MTSSRPRSATRLLLVALVLAGPRVGRAQEAPPQEGERQRFREASETGVRYYNSGQYEQAIQAFREAYVLKPKAVLLYNMANAHRRLGQLEDAVTLYERFLGEEPEPPLRAEAEEHLARVRAEILHREQVRREQLQRERELARTRAMAPIAVPPPPLHRRAWFWGLVGTLAAGTIVAVSLGAYFGAPRDPPSDLGTFPVR